jgi:hypothetical protein
MTPRLLVIFLAVAFAVTATVACSDDAVDRDEAVDRVIAESGGRITREQADCYVDRVLAELGGQPLRSDASIPPEVQARLTTIRVDCIGLVDLGTSPSTASSDPVEGGLPGPKRRGDDPVLDAMWDQCAAGFGSVCDELFDEAPMGSEYESFGASCGGRTREERCAAVYPSPGVTLPSEAQPTTTPPPPSP